MGYLKGYRDSIGVRRSKPETDNSEEILDIYEVCIECNEIKPIYKLGLCERCYTELFKEGQ